jgi:hypothetical protein
MSNLTELFKIGNEDSLKIQDGILHQLFLDSLEEEVLHQLFWMELEDIDGCSILAYNGYCMSDLFISHKTLSVDYEIYRDENIQTGITPKKYVGGKLYAHEKRDWVNVDYELSHELTERLVEDFEGPAEIRDVVGSLSETYFLTKTLIYRNSEQYESKYGIKLLRYNSAETVDAYSEYVDLENFDASADFIHKKAKFSWKMLPLIKKTLILDSLINELKSADYNPSKDAEHFLGCMALHPYTPSEILEILASLGNNLVNSTLARRATAS